MPLPDDIRVEKCLRIGIALECSGHAAEDAEQCRPGPAPAVRAQGMTDAAFAGELLFTIADFRGRVETSCGTRPLEELGRKLEKLPPRDKIIQPGDHDRLSVRHDHHRPDRSVRSIEIANNGPVLGVDNHDPPLCISKCQHLIGRAAVSGQHGTRSSPRRITPLPSDSLSIFIVPSDEPKATMSLASSTTKTDTLHPLLDYAADIFAI